MNFSEKMDTIRYVLGENYTVKDNFDNMNMRYYIHIKRDGTNWNLKMEFSSSDIMMMGENFIGAVCRAAVSEFGVYVAKRFDKGVY